LAHPNSIKQQQHRLLSAVAVVVALAAALRHQLH